jgi:hypothetical protein
MFFPRHYTEKSCAVSRMKSSSIVQILKWIIYATRKFILITLKKKYEGKSMYLIWLRYYP